MFYSGHGFAEGNRILLQMLCEAGHRVRIEAHDRAERGLVLSARASRELQAFERTELSSKDLYFCNWMGTHVRYRDDFRFSIVRTTFESDRIPPEWVPELNRFDEVWVQSAFNRATFSESGVSVPLRLVPNFFDTDRYQPEGEKLELPVAESFLFLSVFDMQLRKGYDLLLQAFLDEFSQGEDVALVLKIRDSTVSNRLSAIIHAHPKKARQRPPVYMIEQMLPEEQLLALYRSCDVFVLPTRGEGWGRPYFEAMLMELPVIGTDWGGQTEFMNEANAYLIQSEPSDPITDHELPIFNGHRWANPSVADLKRKLRHVYLRREEARAKGRRARLDLLARFGREEVNKIVRQELHKFEQRLCQRMGDQA